MFGIDGTSKNKDSIHKGRSPEDRTQFESRQTQK